MAGPAAKYTSGLRHQLSLVLPVAYQSNNLNTQRLLLVLRAIPSICRSNKRGLVPQCAHAVTGPGAGGRADGMGLTVSSRLGFLLWLSLLCLAPLCTRILVDHSTRGGKIYCT